MYGLMLFEPSMSSYPVFRCKGSKQKLVPFHLTRGAGVASGGGWQLGVQ